MTSITPQLIESLAKWSKPVEVQTKMGPRLLRKAPVSESFSNLYKQQKEAVKKLGAGFSKNNMDQWELVWWIPLDEEELQRRAQSLEASRAVSLDQEFPHPHNLDYMPFQKAAIQFALARRGTLLADEMGLGKTIQAIGVINSDPQIENIIIVCPKTLKLNWLTELRRWLVKNLTISIPTRYLPQSNIIILHYENVKKFIEAIHQRTWDLCIVDEAHFIKNTKAQRSKLVKSIQAARTIRMTGTPIVNRPAELYNLISDLGGNWGTYWQFVGRYASAYQSQWGLNVSGASHLEELQTRLRSTIMIRRLKRDVLTELPAKVRQIIEIEPETDAQKAAVQNEQWHQAEANQLLADLKSVVYATQDEHDEAYKTAVKKLKKAEMVDFAALAKLRHETALAKLPAVIDHICACLEDNDNKIIIAAHHRDVIHQIAVGLQKFMPVILTGENTVQERQTAVDMFQQNPQTRVFIGSITAAGTGITLTAASHVVFAELDWVPGNITQMEDRAHRIGQSESVLVQHLVLSGSLDAHMAKMLVDKQTVIDKAVNLKSPSEVQIA